jgi:TP901 family phage tail tape measure protein
MSRFVLTAQLQLQAPNNVAQIARQIQSQLNNVNVNVQLQNVGQAQRQLNNVTTSINNATTAADRMGRAFGTSIRRFAALGIATRAVSLFTNTVSSAIKEAIAFEQELVKVIQVSGATRQELNALVNTVTRLSTSLGVSSRDVLQAGKVLVQAGVSFDDARIALDALAKSALAPNFDSLAETTEGAVAILAQFKQGVGALEGQLSSVNAVAGAFAVEAADLIDVVRRAGGVFKSSGGSLNELLALFTSVRATTRESAESIGTGLRTIFTRIQRPKTIEFLKQFGIQLTDLNGRFVGPFEAARRLSGALAGLGEGDITFIRIAEELGGFRQIGKVLPLLQQFQTAQEALNVAQNAGTGLTKDALTAQQALAVRITKVKEEFLALARSITETTSFQVFANTALNLASALIKLADSLQPIIPLLTAVAGIRLARGFGNFAGGILGGLGSARGFNKGGKVRHFASGGMVPGSGNRDTVPAMLTPGEFVIRKSSVNKLGANNLAAMNKNRYAIGGVVGGVALTPSDQTSTGRGKVAISDIIKALTTNSNIPGGISGNKAIFEGVTSRKQANEIIASVGGFNNTTPSSSRSFTAKGQSFKDADLDRQIGDDVDVGMKNLISNAAAVLGNSIGVSISGSPDARLIQSIGSADVIGKIFEGALNLLGAPFDPLAAKQDRDVFDFPLGLGEIGRAHV